MTDYDTLARRLLGCEARERRMHLWCETHDEPWPCPRATEVADELAEAWRAETDALLERLAAAERRIKAVRALHIVEGGCCDDDPDRCYECGDEWPCPTIEAFVAALRETS